MPPSQLYRVPSVHQKFAGVDHRLYVSDHRYALVSALSDSRSRTTSQPGVELDRIFVRGDFNISWTPLSAGWKSSHLYTLRYTDNPNVFQRRAWRAFAFIDHSLFIEGLDVSTTTAASEMSLEYDDEHAVLLCG